MSASDPKLSSSTSRKPRHLVARITAVLALIVAVGSALAVDAQEAAAKTIDKHNFEFGAGHRTESQRLELGIKNVANVEYFTTAQSAGAYVGLPRTYYGRRAWHY